MTGLTLSRLYYQQIGRPAIEKEFPQYISRIAVGLVGDGSECFGYDDEISRDHDFGPGFCIWLDKNDYESVGEKIQELYESLPKEFMGFKARNTSRRGTGRVGVFEISSFYRQYIGNEQPPASLMRWLYLPEHKIATAVNGEVFEDNLGKFTQIRDTLSQYYPEDVRIKKIAARAAAMAQSGQYNYARCMRRGEVVAAAMAQAEFVKNAVSMLFLLNRQYCPYYKWQFHRLEKLKAANPDFVCGEAVDMIKELVICPEQISAWQSPHPENWNPYVNIFDKKVVLTEKICAVVIKELQRQKLTHRTEDFLEAHTWSIMDSIRDLELRHCHVTEG